MSNATYRAAIDRVLRPMGFDRDKPDDWRRTAASVQQQISLLRAPTEGVLVMLVAFDIESKAICEAAKVKPPVSFYKALSEFENPKRQFWVNDRNGPAEVADMLLRYGVPFLDKFKDPEEQARSFGLDWLGREPGFPNLAARFGLAVTLERMGRRADACRALQVPRRRTEVASWRERVETLRVFLGCAVDSN